MAISHVGTTTADYTSTTPTAQSVTLPSGWQQGDLILLFVPQGVATGSTTVTWTGATNAGNALGGSDMFTTLYYKIAGASESPTFSTSDASSRSSVVVAVYRGVDQTTPIDTTIGFTDSPAGATHTIPSQTVTANAWLVSLAALDGSAGTASPQFTHPSGWTERLDYLNNTSDNYASALADTGPLTAGTKSGHTWTSTYTDRAVNVTVVALREAASSITATLAATAATTATGVLGPNLDSRLVGIGKIRVKTTNADSVRLKIGTDTAVTTGVTYTSAQTPDASGYTTHDISGLAANSTFYYRVAMTAGGEVLDSHATVGRIKTAASGSFNFCFAACTDATDSASMSAIATRADDFFLHVGDLYYADGSGTGAANFRTKFDAKITAANHASVFATTPSLFIPSDHDGGMNNNYVGTGDTTARDNYSLVYRERIPTAVVPATTGVYHAFSWGRVRFLMLDCRSFKSANAATDNSSKTMLGTTQKQWVKDEITNATEPVIILVGDVPWTAATTAGEDTWGGYNTERQELVTHFATVPNKHIGYIGGDMHAVAADDGTNSAGSIPTWQAGPLNNSASIKGGPYTAGPYPASGSAVVQQYGRMVVTDAGGTITFDFTGYSSDNTVRVTQSTVFDVGGSASLASTASISATGVLGKVATATLSATRSVTTTAVKALFGTATQAATGTISASSGGGLSATAALSATGGIATTAVKGLRATATVAETSVITPTAPVIVYVFEPPVHEEPIRTRIRPLYYYRMTYAKSVVRVGGTFTQVRTPSPELLEAAGEEGVDYFLGGRVYTISSVTASELVAAGFTVTT